MNQTHGLSLLAIRRLHSYDVASVSSRDLADEKSQNGNSGSTLFAGLDSQEFGRALRRSIERAWLTLEIIVGHDAVANNLSASGQHALALILDNPSLEHLLASPAPFRQAIWRDLHAARKYGALLQGEIDVENLFQQLTCLTAPIDSQRLQDLEWYALWQMADGLREEGYGRLGSLLEMRSENGDSLLVGLVASFVPNEMELEGALLRISGTEILPEPQIIWLREQSEPLEELLNAAFAGARSENRAEAVQAAARVRQGLSCAQSGEYERAIVEFNAALLAEPANAAFYVHRGDAHRLRGEYESAAADYSAALRLEPKHVAARVNRGLVQRLLGRFESSIVDFDEALRLDPRHVAALSGRGATHADLGRFDLAIADYSHAIHLDPSLAWAYHSRGAAYASSADYDLAIADFTHALRINSHLPLSFANRGDAYRLKGDFDRAIADYSEALRLDPLNPRVLSNRGDAYRHQEQLARALADFTEAIRVDSASPSTYLRRGVVHQVAEDYELALADFDRAEQLDSTNPEVFKQRALVHQLQRSYDDALVDLNQLIRLKPQDATAFASRGNIHGRRHDLSRAIIDFTEAIRLDPNFAQAYQDRGRIYAEDGNYQAALDDCAEASRLKPQLVPARLVRGGVLIRVGEYEKALEEFNEAIRINPRSAKAYNNRGVAYSKIGRIEEAMADFRRALEYSPNYAQAYANRANAHHLLGQNQFALKDFTRALLLDTKYAAAYCVQRGLGEVERGCHDQAIADYTIALVIDPQNSAAFQARNQALVMREQQIAAAPDKPEDTHFTLDSELEDGKTGQANAQRLTKQPAAPIAVTLATPRTEHEIDLRADDATAEHPALAPPASSDKSNHGDSGSSSLTEIDVADEVEVFIDAVAPNNPAPDPMPTERLPPSAKNAMSQEPLEVGTMGPNALESQNLPPATLRTPLKRSKLKAKKASLSDDDDNGFLMRWRKPILIAGCLTFVYLLSTQLGIFRRSPQSIAVAAQKAPLAVAHKVTATELWEEFAANRSTANAKYGNSLIQISGKVSAVVDEPKRKCVLLETPTKAKWTIELDFATPEAFRAVQVGQDIVVHGELEPFMGGKSNLQVFLCRAVKP